MKMTEFQTDALSVTVNIAMTAVGGRPGAAVLTTFAFVTAMSLSSS